MSSRQDFEARVANAARVREAYWANQRARDQSRERGRRYRERRAEKAHADALARWVAAVTHAEGGAA